MGEVQDPISFGDLKIDLKDMIDRGRDSTINDRILGRVLNGAEQFICNRLGGFAKFLEDTEEITLTGGSTTYTFRPSVKKVISIRDENNVWRLEWIDRERFNAYLVNPAFQTGSPLFWTDFGFVRRTNAESPQQQYGQLKIEVSPQPASDTTAFVDEILRAGFMVDDTDFPVMPAEYHWGLLNVAAWMLGPRDVGNKAYTQFREVAREWLENIMRGEIRNLAGNQRIVPREDFERRSGANPSITPPTRFNQLWGGS